MPGMMDPRMLQMMQAQGRTPGMGAPAGPLSAVQLTPGFRVPGLMAGGVGTPPKDGGFNPAALAGMAALLGDGGKGTGKGTGKTTAEGGVGAGGMGSALPGYGSIAAGATTPMVSSVGGSVVPSGLFDNNLAEAAQSGSFLAFLRRNGLI